MNKQGTFVKVNGNDIYYEVYGEGPPLLLLHGAYGNVDVQWKDHISIYSKYFQVFALDARGHGKSKNSSGTLTWEMLIQDVLKFIDVLNLDRPFISGWSMGASIALNIAIMYPNTARAFVIGGTSHKVEDEGKRLRPIKELGILGPGNIDHQTYQKNFGLYETIKAGYGDKFEELVRNISHLMYDRPPEYELNNIRKVEIPIMLIIGDRDHGTTVEEITELYRQLPNAELAVIPGAGHSMCRTKPGLYAHLVRDFLLRQQENE